VINGNLIDRLAIIWRSSGEQREVTTWWKTKGCGTKGCSTKGKNAKKGYPTISI